MFKVSGRGRGPARLSQGQPEVSQREISEWGNWQNLLVDDLSRGGLVCLWGWVAGGGGWGGWTWSSDRVTSEFAK